MAKVEISDFGRLEFDVSAGASWRSCFAVSELAVLSMGAVGSAVADLIAALGLGSRPTVTVDQRLASLWFQGSIQPQRWTIPPLWDAVAGDYPAQDGWIRLHTNAPHHRVAALSVLECRPEKDAVAEAVRGWAKDALEKEVVAAGGAAAAMRSRADWVAHPQGQAVAGEPLVRWARRSGECRDWQPTNDRPLAGLRVLDLTRVLAGAISTRALAGFGADVLRVDPPDWQEPGVVPDVTLGKRCSRLDLKSAEGLSRFETLIAGADVLVHGYRPGALDSILSPARRAALAPNLIEVCLDAYGWTGPWAGRRGFDSLVQMSSGIAEAGSRWAGTDRPHPLPVQALDHATGYLMAASVITGLKHALAQREVGTAHLSLARTAELLVSLDGASSADLTGPVEADFSDQIEHTPWGPANRLRPAIHVTDTPMRWDRPASNLGSVDPAWD
ncbi:CoA transferase [Ruegeria sp. 2205SS24-7]|uniref:CoA transferase n=1 Tax=Ruegeria discodermiae TaxID=3064389 RepID=UPI002740BD87|nr:CoA transferase [Ruegeria sp. 2205SS24-7]MDP5220443.1 CoA transferase [Ruegeria sp. 2205SS24-7]